MKYDDHEYHRTPKRALVWGACGFIGRHLVARTISLGWNVSVLTKERARYVPPEWGSVVEWYELRGDERDSDVIRESLAGADLVYVLSMKGSPYEASVRPHQSLVDTCEPQLMFLNECLKNKQCPHVVVASTRQVYGITGRKPVKEDHPLAPISLYGVAAIAVENCYRIYARRGALSYTICRLTNVYGDAGDCPQLSHGVINKLISGAARGEPLRVFGSGEQLRDYIHIEDAVDALVACGVLERAAGRTFNIGCGTSIRFCDAASSIAALTGARLVFAPWPEDYWVVEAGDFICDIGSAKEALGFNPRFSFCDGIQHVIGSSPVRPELDLQIDSGALIARRREQ